MIESMAPGGTLAPAADAARAQLIVMRGADAGRAFPVETEKVVLGRAQDAEVQLCDDGVSRQHARLNRGGEGDWCVEDLGSTNGTFVNGERVSWAGLTFGDRLRLGSNIELLFAEDDAMREELLKRQRFEAVGRLSLGIAHDFNNMLATMSATLDYLGDTPLTQLAADDYNSCILDMRTAVERAAHLATRLLNSGSGSTGRPERLNLSELVEEITHLAKRSFPRNIALDLRIAPRLAVLGDAVAIHQVLMNLLVNARDAMPSGGRLTISLRPIDGRSRVELAVEDTGVGMDMATQARLFEPFFTTKGDGLGFGLGLATVKAIVERHGGTIGLHSFPGKGARFVICLPREASRPRHHRMRTKGNDRTLPQLPARVLLADDEPSLRRALRRLLTAAEVDVVEAVDGRDALVRAADEALPPSAAILDVDMPELDGLEVARRLAEQQPDLPVIILSGHDVGALRQRLQDTAVLAVLKKPVASNELIAALHTAWLAANPGEPRLTVA